ncbi:hypothetical protein [Olsenella phocaeensis]|uniref:hypothetical protein n=1 Tax=Olsenella phocaeensis TaxID=1852385 RepID=UPI003A8DB8A2
MLYGVLSDGTVTLTVPSEGKPVIESVEPEAPEGYVSTMGWEETGTEIRQTWALGLSDDARRLRDEIEALPDDVAALIPSAYGRFEEGRTYGRGERFRVGETLYRVLQDYDSRAWPDPSAVPALVTRVSPGQSGEVGKWVQPTNESPYMRGDRAENLGKIWESAIDDNVWEPGAPGVDERYWTCLGDA